MPAGVTRHEDTSFRVFVDGDEKGSYKATEFSWDPMVNHDSSKYQGDPIPKKDSTFNGYTLSATFELAPGGADPTEFFDDFIEGVKARTNTGRIRIVVSYTDLATGKIAAMRFDNVQAKVGGRSRQEDRVTFSLSGEAEDGRKVK